jgi:hypothetical protein
MSKLNLAQFRAEMIAAAKAKAAMNNVGLEALKQQLLEKKQELAELLQLKKEILELLRSNPASAEYTQLKQQVESTEAQARSVELEIRNLTLGGSSTPVVETVPQSTPVVITPTVQPKPPLEVRSEDVPEGGKSTDGEEFSVGDEGQFILVIDEDSEVDVEFFINGNWESESSKLPAGYEPKWYRIAGR